MLLSCRISISISILILILLLLRIHPLYLLDALVLPLELSRVCSCITCITRMLYHVELSRVFSMLLSCRGGQCRWGHMASGAITCRRPAFSYIHACSYFYFTWGRRSRWWVRRYHGSAGADNHADVVTCRLARNFKRCTCPCVFFSLEQEKTVARDLLVQMLARDLRQFMPLHVYCTWADAPTREPSGSWSHVLITCIDHVYWSRESITCIDHVGWRTHARTIRKLITISCQRSCHTPSSHATQWKE